MTLLICFLVISLTPISAVKIAGINTATTPNMIQEQCVKADSKKGDEIQQAYDDEVKKKTEILKNSSHVLKLVLQELQGITSKIKEVKDDYTAKRDDYWIILRKIGGNLGNGVIAPKN